MKTKAKPARSLGILFFAVGALIVTLTFGALSWAKLEADFYFGYDVPPDRPLTTLHCPPLMAARETSAVTIRLNNPLDVSVSPFILSDISRNGAIAHEQDYYPITPGQTRTLRWELSADNEVFGSLILVKIMVNEVRSLPSRGGTCATLVLNLPYLTGAQALAIVLAAGLLSLAVGWGLWFTATRPARGRALDATRAMVLLTAVILAGLLAGFLGWWVVGTACVVIVLLLSVTLGGHLIQLSS